MHARRRPSPVPWVAGFRTSKSPQPTYYVCRWQAGNASIQMGAKTFTANHYHLHPLCPVTLSHSVGKARCLLSHVVCFHFHLHRSHGITILESVLKFVISQGSIEPS